MPSSTQPHPPRDRALEVEAPSSSLQRKSTDSVLPRNQLTKIIDRTPPHLHVTLVS